MLLPGLRSLKYLGFVNVSYPEFLNPGNITSNSSSVTVFNISLKNNGFVWAIAERLNISIKGRVIYVPTPTLDQMKRGLNSTDEIA